MVLDIHSPLVTSLSRSHRVLSGASSLAGVHGSTPRRGGTWHGMGLRGGSGWTFQEKPRMSQATEVREFGGSGCFAHGQDLEARKRH